MEKKVDEKILESEIQPKKYSGAELKGLKSFIDKVKNVKARTSLACWGDHSEYSRGYWNLKFKILNPVPFSELDFFFGGKIIYDEKSQENHRIEADDGLQSCL